MALLHRAQRPQEADARQDSSQAKRGGTRAAAAERKREQATEDSIKQAVDAVCVGSSLWVYPGGRRTRDGKPQLRAFQTYVQMSPLAFLLIAGKKQKVRPRPPHSVRSLPVRERAGACLARVLKMFFFVCVFCAGFDPGGACVGKRRVPARVRARRRRNALRLPHPGRAARRAEQRRRGGHPRLPHKKQRRARRLDPRRHGVRRVLLIHTDH